MVTTARRVAKPVSLLILMLITLGAGPVTAAPQLDPAAAGAATSPTSDAASTPTAPPSREFAAYSWAPPGDPTPGRGLRWIDSQPRWLDTTTSSSTPAKTGSWWSRRTTAQ